MKRERFASHFFYIIFFIWYSTDIIFSTNLENKCNDFLMDFFELDSMDIGAFVNLLVFALLLLEMFIQQYCFREIAIIAALAIPISISTIISDNRFLMSFLMFVVAAKYSHLDTIIKQAWFILTISTIAIILLCKWGYLPDVHMYRNEMVRHSLGFEHPNSLGIIVFQWAACFLYCLEDRISSVITYLILLACSVFAYLVPNSQTAYISILVLLAIVIVKKLLCKNDKSLIAFMNTMGIGTIVLNVGSVLLSITSHEKGTLIGNIDKFLSYRFTYCNIMYHYYDIRLFGQKIYTLVKDKKYIGVYRQLHLDNAYFCVLLTFGFVVYLVFTYIQLSTIYYFIAQQNVVMVSILFVYAVYGVMETGYFTLSNNVFLFAFSYVLYKKINEQPVRKRKLIVTF